MADAKTKRMGMVKVGLEVLGDMLHLPKGVRICQLVEVSDDAVNRTATILMEGNGMPETKEGDRIPVVSLEFVRQGECPACQQEKIKMIGANIFEKSEDKKK